MKENVTIEKKMDEVLDDLKLHTSRAYTMIIHKIKAIVLEVEDVLFHHDSAVLMPTKPEGPSSSQGGDTGEDQEIIAGLAVIKATYHFMQENPGKKLIIAGHTDTSGPAKYNFELSGLRAMAVLHVLMGDRVGWVDTVKDKHKTEDYQQILTHFHSKFGWDCDPDGVDNVHGSKTETALRNFETIYNEKFTKSVTFAAPKYAEMWGAIFDVYMEEMAGAMGEKDVAGLAKWRSSIRFVDQSKKILPCGESIPANSPGIDGVKSQTNRRVEVVFFDADELPILDCLPSGNKTHPQDKCPIYNTDWVEHEYIDPAVIGPLPPTVTHEISITKVDSPHFVPDVEEINIDYKILGPLEQVSKVKLMVSTEKEPDKQILGKELAPPFNAAGTISWKGDVIGGDFDGFINLASSPYLLQLVLETTAAKACESNKEKVEIILESTEMFVDDPAKANIPAQHQPVIKALKTELASNAGKGTIIMNSPIFKINSNEMNNSSSFTTYRSQWSQGASVPLFAKIWLKGKDGSKKRSAKAVAKTKVLWNAELNDDSAYDAVLISRGVHNKGKTFVKKVSAYKKDETEPKGRTAHKYFGGVRAKASERVSAEKQWKSLNSGWPISTPGTRKWATYTLCGAVADLDAETGIFFVGGRMAGDIHKLTAYVDLDGSLDATDDSKLSGAPAKQKSKMITLKNWRRIDVVQNFKMGASTTELDIAALDKEYKKAAMTIKAGSGVTVQNKQAQWKTHYQTVIGAMGSSSDFVKHATLSDPGLYPVKYRSYNDYWSRANPSTGFWGTLGQRISSLFGSADENTYRKECDKYAYRIYSKVAKKFPLPNNGLSFFKFGENGDHNMWKGSYTAGIAPSIPGYTNRNKAVFFVFNKGKATDTLIHEVGHLIFLAHAPGHFEAGKQPAGYQPNAHDENQICVMSYHNSAKYLCGICIFKLSGWNYRKIKKDGTIS